MQETLSAAAGATIDEHLQRRLEQLAARTGWTPAELIAAAIDEYVDRRDRASVPSWVGAAGSAVEARIGRRR
jgi:predicted transcriptional regulator